MTSAVGAVAEPERERAARVERADVAGILDQREVVRARGLVELAELLGEPRDLEPRAARAPRDTGAARAHRRQLGSNRNGSGVQNR